MGQCGARDGARLEVREESVRRAAGRWPQLALGALSAESAFISVRSIRGRHWAADGGRTQWAASSHLHQPWIVAGVTGGLAAPLVAAGAATIIGSAGAAALGSVAGIAVLTSLFGAAGAGLTGKAPKGWWPRGDFQPGAPGCSKTCPDSHPRWLPRGRRRIRLFSRWVPAPPEPIAGFPQTCPRSLAWVRKELDVSTCPCTDFLRRV